MSSSVSVLSRFSQVRRTAAVLTIAVVAAVLVPVSTSAALAAAPTSAPTITAPADATTVGSPGLPVSATSSAAQVRFVLDGREGNPDYDKTVSVSGGSASTQFSVLGLSGSTQVDAYDCDDVGSCNTVDKGTVTVTVDLNDPTIVSPGDGDVVHSSVTVRVDAPGPTIQFFVNGTPVGKDTAAPLERKISLSAYSDGSLTIKVRQCSTDGTVCGGEEDSITVIKDTKGPRWSDLSTSNRTVFPVKDRYKDSTLLSARVGERSLETKVEIRKAGGPVVRTIKLGRVDPGKVRATWNGRKNNGNIVSKGKYLFRFVGTDVHGVVGKSGDKAVYVSDKKLVKKTVNKTVSALSSGLGDYSGDCSRVVVMRSLDGYARSWRNGLQWQSNAKRNCSGSASVALSAHVAKTEKAIRYGTFQISAYGGAALRNGGPAKILYIKSNETLGARQGLGTGLGWHKGDREALSKYLFGTRLVWYVGTANGNWYDIKEFKITYTVTVLR
jgi:hypothetical protein